MLEILKRRKATEEAAESGPAPNRLTAQSLSNLFDERKSAKTRAEVEVLCKEYGIDIGVLEELGKHVNAPSVSSYKSLKEEVEETQMVRSAASEEGWDVANCLRDRRLDGLMHRWRHRVRSKHDEEQFGQGSWRIPQCNTIAVDREAEARSSS